MKLRSLTALAASILIAISSGADPAASVTREQIWETFHTVRYQQFGEFQEIDLYAENSDSTQICYISGAAIYMFYYKDPDGGTPAHIDVVTPAKMIFPSKINRITCSPRTGEESCESFNLWYYEKLELTL